MHQVPGVADYLAIGLFFFALLLALQKNRLTWSDVASWVIGVFLAAFLVRQLFHVNPIGIFGIADFFLLFSLPDDKKPLFRPLPFFSSYDWKSPTRRK